MTIIRQLAIFLALTLAAGSAAAQAAASYRDAYRTMIWFEKYGKPKQLIQNHYQVVARERGAGTEGVRLTLAGTSQQLELALDAVGRAVFPFSKAAYDDNAALVLNRRAGEFTQQARTSIAARADGVYEAAELRAACEQVLAYQRYLDASFQRGKACVGVKFAYPRKGQAPVQFRKGERDTAALPAGEGTAFWDEGGETYAVASYRFAAWPEKGQLLTASAPLAISPLFE